jgi:heterotetrameric sarcosine oxidase alpha subunit
MSGSHRRADGERVDRQRPLAFTFDGRPYVGFAGDTLASALLGNGVKLFGRSFKYHRPRGVLSAGVEEPNALVGVGVGGRFEPNTRATDLFLYEGLTAVSQNRWPSLAFDAGAINRLIARFIPAGFYYKTFFGGPRLWLLYERVIRRAAGLGAAPKTAEVDAFEHRAAFCDVLVVGAGPAGLAAARAAADAGARVILVEQDRRLGGSLLRDAATIDGQDALTWATEVTKVVTSAGGRILTRTTAIGAWDHGVVTLAERMTEPGEPPKGDAPAQRLWRVRAKRVVLATGAIERPLLFSGNDTPGVMLSSAVRTYVERFAVLPGRRVAIVTCNDDAYLTALAIRAAGGDVAAVLDLRPGADSDVVRQAQSSMPVYFGAEPVKALGGKDGVTGLTALAGGKPISLACDLIAVSGGFTPVVHLHMHAGGSLDWDDASGAFIPGAARQNQISAGGAAGADSLDAHLKGGHTAGSKSAALIGFAPLIEAPAPTAVAQQASGLGKAYTPAPGVRLKTAFVDYQNDVTAADLDLAWQEGYRSVEHLKRYTTLGMATDQGKTSNLLGLARLAQAEGRPMPQVGLTTFRPPYTPVTLGVLAGEAVGRHVAPQRRLKLYRLHAARAPLWQPSGYWARPRAYPRAGETLIQAALREARAVRTTVGLTDVSTLAKFEVAGPDAAALLELVCATTVAKLAVGRGRYTFMLREDGFVVDDGTVWRIEDQRFLLTSSTGGADRMTAHISYIRKILAPQLKVAVSNVQEHWCAAALAGPQARAVAASLLDVEPPRHMSTVKGAIAGVPVLVLAASYSGERAFEIYAAAPQMEPVWTALAEGVVAAGGALYGLEALELLRIEKGHIEVGAEIDGRRTPADVGLQKMLNPRGGFVGAQGLTRPTLQADGRQTLVGLEAEAPIPEGAMLVTSVGAAPEGHVSSAGLRLVGEGGVALGLLLNGSARLGETLLATSPTRGRTVTVRVAPPHFHDPSGERYRDDLR